MQSRSMSLVEAVTNVTVGWLVALATQLIAFPVFGVQASLGQSLGISGVFTAVSLVRSYVLRRLFDGLGAPRGEGGMLLWSLRVGTGGGRPPVTPAKLGGGYPPAERAGFPANTGLSGATSRLVARPTHTPEA